MTQLFRSRGTRPSQAANLRPLRKPLGSVPQRASTRGDALLLLAIGFVLWLRSVKISGPRAIGAEG